MSSATKIADDFPAIKAALEKLEQENKPEAAMPKAWPDYTPVESVYDGTYGGVIGCGWTEGLLAGYVPSMYLAPDTDAA